MRVELNGHRFLIDDEDWDRLSHLPWRAAMNSKGRPVVTRQQGSRNSGTLRNIYIYQDILGVSGADRCVDHINGDPSDHRRSNLRICSAKENMRNRRPDRNSKAIYKGVSPKKNRFVARIHADGRSLHLGSFKTPESAARAYDAAAERYFGDFAWLNRDHFTLDTEGQV